MGRGFPLPPASAHAPSRAHPSPLPGPAGRPPPVSFGWLTVLALLMGAVQAYLIVNKLWIRKHEPAVAESVSIMGETVGLFTLAVLTVGFLAQGAWEGVVDGLIWVVAGTVTVVVGSGRWVEGRRRRGFWALIRDALRLERDEVGDLARSFFRPSGARQILRILAQVALIDRELDDRERAFIDSFAHAWGLDFSWEDLREEVEGDDLDFVNLRAALEDYLERSPPAAQASQLGDVLGALVAIDEETTEEERLILDELQGMLAGYVDADGVGEGWGVAIVPQDPEQDRAIATLLPDVGKRRVEGGMAYVLGPYYSARYADLMGNRYRALSFFTTVVRLAHEPVAPEDARAR